MAISSEPANYELVSSDSLRQGPLLFLTLQMIQPIGLGCKHKGGKRVTVSKPQLTSTVFLHSSV